MEIGEWLFFTDMGAYTIAAATHFNGFDGAVDYIYMYGDTIVAPSMLETVESTANTLAQFAPALSSVISSPSTTVGDSPVVNMED